MYTLYSGRLARIFLCLIVACALFAQSVGATDANSATDTSGKTLHVLASTFPVYQITRNVTRGLAHVQVELLLPAAAGCPHDYALTPADMRKLEQADVLVRNGFGLDDFLIPALRKTVKQPLSITAGTGITPLPATGTKQQAADGPATEHVHSYEHSHAANAVNPHIFASPRRVSVMAQNIADGLAVADPAHAAAYKAAAQDYAVRMAALDARLAAVGAAAPRKGIVLQHDAAAYTASDAGLEVIAVLQENEEQSPSAARLLALTTLIRLQKPQLIIADAQYSPRLAQTLAQETGVACATVDTGASGPEDAPPDYFETITAAAVQTLERYLVPAR